MVDKNKRKRPNYVLAEIRTIEEENTTIERIIEREEDNNSEND